MKAICKKLPKTMLFLGPSGSGKDTQIDLLTDLCGYVSIGTGEMFREEYEKKTELGRKAFEYWGKGEWVPDDLVYQLFSEYLKKYDSTKPWIFSQVVRTSAQIDLFDSLLEKFDRTLDKVVYFNLSEEAAIERMSLRRFCPVCNRDYHLKYKKPLSDDICDDCKVPLEIRPDDHPDAIRKRLDEFNEKTRPVLDAYRKKGILIEVDASPSINDIHKTLLETFSNG